MQIRPTTNVQTSQAVNLQTRNTTDKSTGAVPVDQPIIIDGYGDGWEDLDFQVIESSSSINPLAIQYKATTRRGHLFLFQKIVFA